MNRNCKWCESSFKVTRPSKIYCSKKCGDAFHHAKRPKKVKLPKSCKRCGKEFIYSSTKSNQEFCSSLCWNRDYRSRTPEKQQIYRENHKPYLLKYRQKNREYLNQQSLENHNQRKFGGLKPEVLKRDNYQCALCDSTENLVIHHINPENILDNLQTLCRSCHFKEHKRINPEAYSR